MVWIDEIRNVYENYFKETFENLELVEYEMMDGPGMGALVKYKNDFLRLQILNDRGIIEIGISSLVGEEEFIDFESISAYLMLSKANDISDFKKRQIILTRLDFQAHSTFLQTYSTRIKEILDSEHIETTLKDLADLNQERFT
jgi:hypothetical protein